MKVGISHKGESGYRAPVEPIFGSSNDQYHSEQAGHGFDNGVNTRDELDFRKVTSWTQM